MQYTGKKVRGKKQTKTHSIDCAFYCFPKEQSYAVNMNIQVKNTEITVKELIVQNPNVTTSTKRNLPYPNFCW